MGGRRGSVIRSSVGVWLRIMKRKNQGLYNGRVRERMGRK